MESKTISKGILRALATLVIIVAIGWFFLKIQTLVIYLIVSAIITLISKPLIVFLNKKLRFPNTLAAICVLAIYSGIAIAFTSLFAPLISKQSENISLLNSAGFKSKITHVVQEIDNYLLSKNINVLNQIKEIDFMPAFKNIPEIINGVLGSLGSLGIALFSIVFISFFFMVDTTIIKKSLFVFVSKKNVYKAARSLETIKELLSRYFIGLSIQISVLFIIYSIVLSIFSIDNAIVIAVLCALLNLIPYIGPLIGGFLMLILVATNNLDLDFQSEILPTTSYVMTGYFIAQMIDNFISQPLIFSKSVKSHPLEIFLIILIFGNLFGIIGMVVSVPAYTAIKVIVQEFYSKNKIVQYLNKH